MRVDLVDGDFYVIDQETHDAHDGEPAFAAVIFDGAYGWHNTYRLIDLAVDHGMRLSDDDRIAVDTYRDERRGATGWPFEAVHELVEEAEDYLNEQVVTVGWSFGWSDSDFVLANHAWWERDV